MAAPAPAPTAAESPDFAANLNLAVTNRLLEYQAMGLNNNQILAEANQMLDGAAAIPPVPGVGGAPGTPGVPRVVGLREQYALSVAERNDRTIGARTKGNMDQAAWAYSVELGVAGAVAFTQLERSARRRGSADPAQEALEMSLLNYVRPDENVVLGARRTPRGRRVPGTQIIGEGSRLAEAVATTREERVGRVTGEGRGRLERWRPGAIFDRAALRFGRMSNRQKMAVRIGAGVVMGAAAVATAGAAVPGMVGAAVAYGGASAAKSTVFARLENRAGVLNSRRQAREVTDQIVANHAAGEPMNIQEMVGGFNEAASRKIRGNRVRLGVAAVAAAVGFHELAVNAPGIDHVANGVAHVAEKAGHAVRNAWDAHVDVSAGSHAAGHHGSGHAAGRGSGHGGKGNKSGSSGSKAPKPAKGTAPKPLASMNAHQTEHLQRTWATGDNANHALRNVDTKHGVKVVMEGMKDGQTVINGHVVNNLPHSTEVLITEHTANGNEIVEVPLNHVVHGHLAELLKHHEYVTEEVATVSNGHADVFATAVGNGHEVSQATFNALTHDGVSAHAAESAAGHAATSTAHEAYPSPAQLKEIAAERAKLYSEFAAHVQGEHGVSTQQLFNQALGHAIANHKLELLNGGKGGFSILEPVSGTNQIEWAPATNAHIYRTLLQQLEEYSKKGTYRLAA